MPSVSFFLSSTNHPVDEQDPLWDCPLPESRSNQVTARQTADAETISYGCYFSAIARFCASNGWRRVVNAAACKLEQPVDENDLKTVSIFLEKHGAFYHPARLQVEVGNKTLTWVVNVAASSQGKLAIKDEMKALEHLNEHRPFGWLPKIYASVYDELPMFMGDWFDGFHEFHLTRRPGGDEPVVVVWDGAEIPCLLSADQMAALYQKMAMILTACYDPITSCQISQWHHAAGDFVVHVDDGRLAVKLITVRNYVPLAGSAANPEDESELMAALVVFFLHLSVRMRLDRIDGVAEIVWAPDLCLAPMIEGFFQGLDLMALLNGFPDTFSGAFRNYFNSYVAAELSSDARRIAETTFSRQTEERAIIDANLDDHIQNIIRLLAG